MSHAGGAMPVLAHRLAIFDTLTPHIERYPKGAKHYLRRLYYDTTLSTDPAQLAALQALVEPSQILFGSDFPYVSEAVVLAEGDRLDGYPGFDARTRLLMERANAEALFPRLAAR
jgi:predicted TIM-barrel fold metal-dependent hydrolase